MIILPPITPLLHICVGVFFHLSLDKFFSFFGVVNRLHRQFCLATGCSEAYGEARNARMTPDRVPELKVSYTSLAYKSNKLLMPSAHGPIFVVENRSENRFVCADFWSDKKLVRFFLGAAYDKDKKSVRVR